MIYIFNIDYSLVNLKSIDNFFDFKKKYSDQNVNLYLVDKIIFCSKIPNFYLYQKLNQFLFVLLLKLIGLIVESWLLNLLFNS